MTFWSTYVTCMCYLDLHTHMLTPTGPDIHQQVRLSGAMSRDSDYDSNWAGLEPLQRECKQKVYDLDTDVCMLVNVLELDLDTCVVAATYLFCCSEMPVLLQRDTCVVAARCLCCCSEITALLQQDTSVFAARCMRCCSKIPALLQQDTCVVAARYSWSYSKISRVSVSRPYSPVDAHDCKRT